MRRWRLAAPETINKPEMDRNLGRASRLGRARPAERARPPLELTCPIQFASRAVMIDCLPEAKWAPWGVAERPEAAPSALISAPVSARAIGRCRALSSCCSGVMKALLQCKYRQPCSLSQYYC